MIKTFLATLVLIAVTGATSHAAAPKTYQVTGQVTDVTDTKIVVTKGKEKFEMDKSATTKTTGTLAKGAKATVSYSMTAQEIEVKKGK